MQAVINHSFESANEKNNSVQLNLAWTDNLLPGDTFRIRYAGMSVFGSTKNSKC